jgi:hypothetical protein
MIWHDNVWQIEGQYAEKGHDMGNIVNRRTLDRTLIVGRIGEVIADVREPDVKGLRAPSENGGY